MDGIKGVIRACSVVVCLVLAVLSLRAEEASRSAHTLVENLDHGKRVALVIGNSVYENATALPNPENDARDMSALLNQLGFDVVDGLNLNKNAMEGRIEQFATKAETAEVVLFYFAGHGMQVDGRNYILPVDAKLETRTSLRFQTVAVDEILELMVGSKRVAIALLDACRDNPLSRRFANTRSNVDRGLAMPELTGGGILIGFATAPGETAADGDGRNSPFAAALLRHLGEPGIEIGQTMKRVMAHVVAATGDRQRPWVHSDIAADFFMAPRPQTANELIAADFNLAKKVGTREAWDTFLARHGQFSDNPYVQLARLLSVPPPPPRPPVLQLPHEPKKVVETGGKPKKKSGVVTTGGKPKKKSGVVTTRTKPKILKRKPSVPPPVTQKSPSSQQLILP